MLKDEANETVTICNGLKSAITRRKNISNQSDKRSIWLNSNIDKGFKKDSPTKLLNCHVKLPNLDLNQRPSD